MEGVYQFYIVARGHQILQSTSTSISEIVKIAKEHGYRCDHPDVWSNVKNTLEYRLFTPGIDVPAGAVIVTAPNEKAFFTAWFEFV